MSKENNKRPSFQFYPSDWLSDPNVMSMTLEEKGAYIQLLATMWTTEDCSLNPDKDYLAKIVGADNSVITALYPCFKVVKGVLRHKRLDYERNKQNLFSKQRSEAGKVGMQNRWKKKLKQSYNNVITKDNSSSSFSSSSSIKKTSLKKDVKPAVYGNESINKILLALKQSIGIEAFSDSRIERNMGRHINNLYEKIGKEEFRRRLDYVLDDNFRRKNCNSIKYLYNQLKSVPIKETNNINQYII